MLDNLDYMVFAIKQAKEAERFGFTRNDCSRNLKTAFHKYWQSRVMKQSQFQKKKLPRSKEAKGKEFNDCKIEHVVP